MVTENGAPPAAAKSLQSCPTLCNPIDSSPRGSPVPGILQARTLGGLPFPSPTHESEKWKWSRSVVSDSSRPHGLQPIRRLHPWDFPGKSTGVGCHRLLHIGNEWINIWWDKYLTAKFWVGCFFIPKPRKNFLTMYHSLYTACTSTRIDIQMLLIQSTFNRKNAIVSLRNFKVNTPSKADSYSTE